MKMPLVAAFMLISALTSVVFAQVIRGGLDKACISNSVSVVMGPN